MEHKEFSWKSSDGITHFAQYWKPDNDTDKPVICIVHGMGEHSSRYYNLINYFIEKGYYITAFDHRGHGKSEGKKGHTPSFDLLLEGITQLLTETESLFKDKQKVLYGHSLGGNLVLNYALRLKSDLLGVIASSPWLKLAFEPPTLQVELGKFVNIFFPSFTQSTNLDHSAMSRDPDEVEKYMKDPLVHDYISSNMFLALRDAGKWAMEHASLFPLPLLLYHGTADEVTSCQASEQFAEKVEKNITFKLWEGYFHECHNDKGRKDVFDYINAWIEQQIEIDRLKKHELL